MTAINTPRETYGELFELVQSAGIFADSKTFADAIPGLAPEAIMRSFKEQGSGEKFDLRAFVDRHFKFDEPDGSGSAPAGDEDVRDHIKHLWEYLTRTDDLSLPSSSRIPLPHPYVVPGGRFGELYYWDSYFTMLGLHLSGRIDLVRNGVDNFAFLIDRLGFIPNSTRSYHATRSQPPFFALMVELLAQATGDDGVFLKYLPQLKAEYAFWMAGSEKRDGDAIADRRVVSFDGHLLNRYWDDSDEPRDESYREDIELCAASGREPAGLCRDIRAACESGWDFSSRWFADGRSMQSLQTTNLIPVDLNALLCKLEQVLAKTCESAGEPEQALFYRQRAEQREVLIQQLFFDVESGFFRDLKWPELKPTGEPSLAAAYPLFFGLAKGPQAHHVANRLQQDFLRPGGWVTTRNFSGQQWDAPNGWAPLQWIVFKALDNYGYHELAQEGAARWIKAVLSTYQTTGRLLEKYDVEQTGLVAGGGEYTVQVGFGWTNGVLLGLLEETAQ